jgi:hypothetical protein
MITSPAGNFSKQFHWLAEIRGEDARKPAADILDRMATVADVASPFCNRSVR